MRIYIICPVRVATEEQKVKILDYVHKLEAEGHEVYYPARDTNQVDITGGWNICLDNADAILESNEVHIFWDEKSLGSLFDLGIAFSVGMPLTIINPEDVDLNNNKSFTHVIDYWSKHL